MDDRTDVVVVGAGIHGAGIAQALAAAGHDVLVLERGAIACGTSSRSSKLVHGGLRYLETGQLGLVRECLRERALLLRLAPDLVRLRPFFVPVFAGARRAPWEIRTGLGLYAALGGLTAETRFRAVPRDAWDDLDGLRTDGLRAVFEYRDAQTDDAELTRAVLRSAEALGAQCRTGAEVVGATVDDRGVTVAWREDDVEQACTAHALVNAAGPWFDLVRRRIDPVPAAPACELVQGAHLVYDVPTRRGMYYVEAPQDGRAVFVMPWRGGTLVGTTETPFTGDPATVAPTDAERAYLAAVLDHSFPGARRGSAPSAAFAGLRVLPAGTGRAERRSRETMLTPDRAPRPRVLTVCGGKLTTYRLTAERVARRLAPTLPSRPRRADTRELPLT